MKLKIIIFNYNGRFFRFKQEGATYVCDICYWKGETTQHADGSWSAVINQKYDPFEHYKSDKPLSNQAEGMSWIASRLIKIEQHH